MPPMLCARLIRLTGDGKQSDGNLTPEVANNAPASPVLLSQTGLRQFMRHAEANNHDCHHTAFCSPSHGCYRTNFSMSEIHMTCLPRALNMRPLTHKTRNQGARLNSFDLENSSSLDDNMRD